MAFGFELHSMTMAGLKLTSRHSIVVPMLC